MLSDIMYYLKNWFAAYLNVNMDFSTSKGPDLVTDIWFQFQFHFIFHIIMIVLSIAILSGVCLLTLFDIITTGE